MTDNSETNSKVEIQKVSKKEYNRLYYLKQKLEKGDVQREPMKKLKNSLNGLMDKETIKKIRTLENNNQELEKSLEKLQTKVIDQIKDKLEDYHSKYGDDLRIKRLFEKLPEFKDEWSLGEKYDWYCNLDKHLF